jgi:CubicO group peptidase (beta-lactamase class C family)
MIYSKIIDKIANNIKDLPDQTQLSIAVIKKGKAGFYGMVKENGSVRQINNTTSAFEIGSVTKAFTGHILAQLVIEKKVNLDDPIQHFLPFTLLNNPLITLKQLAMHTSGLQRMPHDFETQSNYDEDNPFKNYTERLLTTYFTQNLKMDSLPGEKHLYSNLGFGLLSYIISKIEEIPFAKVVAKRIFEPLKMCHSTFDICEVKTNMVKGIDDKGIFCSHWDGGILDGCLGIISTIEDLSRFAIMAADMSDAAGNLQARETFSVEPQLKSKLGWGERLIMPENIRMQGINGGTGGYGASILLNREMNCSVVVLSNIWPWRYMEIIYPLNKELLIEASS